MIGLALVLKPNKNKALLFTHRLLLIFRAKPLRLRLIYSLASQYLVSNTPLSTGHKLSGLASIVLLSLALAPDNCSLFEGSSPALNAMTVS